MGLFGGSERKDIELLPGEKKQVELSAVDYELLRGPATEWSKAVDQEYRLVFEGEKEESVVLDYFEQNHLTRLDLAKIPASALIAQG